MRVAMSVGAETDLTMLRAFLNNGTEPMMATDADDIDIIGYIDFINQMRNSYGGHNDGTRVVEVSDSNYQQFYEYFVRSTKILLDYVD